jgi:CHAT domain-containing protein/Tfp pilus assembly protein PilF
MLRPPRLFAAVVLAGLLVCAAAATSQVPPGELLAGARKVYETAGPAEALPLFEKALDAFRSAGDRRGEAITLGLIGNCHKRLGDLDRALEELRQALAMKRELGDRLEEGKTLSHLGLVLWERAEYPEAIRRLEAAATRGREIGDVKLEGSALNNLALVYDELGDYTRSLAQYHRALELYRQTDFPRGEGDTLGNLGGVYLLLGRFREAMGYYRQALAISTRLAAKPAMSQDLGNIALCHAGVGEADEAIADFDRALMLAREAGLRKEEADWLKGKGTLLVEVGRHSEGLELVRVALARYEASGLQRERVEALEQLALLHLELGDLVGAEESLRRSLGIARAIGHARGVLSDLLALGELERRRQRPEQAATLFREALEGARAAGDRGLEASCRIRLAFVLSDSSEFAPARDEARLGLDLARGEGAKLVEAEARFALGEANRRLGKAEAALEQYVTGERLVEGLGEPDIAWRLAHGSALALESLGRLPEAAEACQRAINRIETVRARLREERLRAGYIEERYQAYVDLARLLLRLHRDDEAFSAAERLRARSYLDLLATDRDPSLTPAQQARAVELRQRIRALERALAGELRGPGKERRQAAETFSSELATAESEYEAFLASLRGTDPALAAAWSLAIPSVAAIRAALPEDTALVEFVVGEDVVMAFVLTPEHLRTHVARVLRRDLTAKVVLLRELILRPGDGWRAPAASLAALLLEPIETAGWLEGRRCLFVVPHGVLHHLPFVLLPFGPQRRFLVEEHELTFLPAAGVLVLPRAVRHPQGTVLAIAPNGGKLRHTSDEARAVAEAYAEPRLLLVGQAATESAFKGAAVGFRILHLATHSRWNRLNPLLSGLELEPSGSDDGHLEVHEILGLRLQASLVTLSACETALGSDLLGSVPAGDDFVGLTRAFLHAGSDAVLASLWEVDDRSTLELMQAFYGRLAQVGPAAALAAAQRSMLTHGHGALARPYDWAAFVLVGVPATKTAARSALLSVKGQ